MNLRNAGPSNEVKAAGEWRDLLKKAQPSPKQMSHSYIVLKEGVYAVRAPSALDETTHKLDISDIVKTSKGIFSAAKKTIISKSQFLSRAQVTELTKIGSEIASYTHTLIEEKQAKRDKPFKKLGRTVALVFSALASVFLIGIPFLILLRRQDKQFENEIHLYNQDVQGIFEEMTQLRMHKRHLDLEMLKTEFNYEGELANHLLDLQENVPALIDRMHELKANLKEFDGKRPVRPSEYKKINQLNRDYEKCKQELKAYVSDIQENQKAAGLSFESAAKYTALKKTFHELNMPVLNSAGYADQIQGIINGTFSEQIDAFVTIEAKKRPTVLLQFEKDIPRFNTFKRRDATRQIDDKQPKPLSASSTKISDAALAISQLIVTLEDQAWIPVLQLAVTQTSLNAAFLLPRLALTDLGHQVSWLKGGRTYYLLPEFPQTGLPPVQLEIIRDAAGSINEVKVVVEGNLDLVKKDVGGSYTPVQVKQEEDEVILKDAFHTELSYTITLDKGTQRPVISDLKCQNKTNILKVGVIQLANASVGAA